VEFTHTIPERLQRQAATCTLMGSPFYGSLLEYAIGAYERDAVLRALLERNAHHSRIGLRLLGGAHYRALRGEAPAIARHFPSTGGDGDAVQSWGAIQNDIRENERAYVELLPRPVQTNEVARALPVLAAMLAIAHASRMPLSVFEIGSSAGLLLNFDRYRYTGEQWAWGDTASPLQLANASVYGTPQHLDAQIDVVERRGCDIHPLHAANAADAATLLSFVWPDQTSRFQRLRAALQIGRAHPPAIDVADGIEWVQNVAQPRRGAATVVMHTVIMEHMPPDVRERLRAAIRNIGESATPESPFAWARMEAASGAYETAVTLWPGRKETLIARSDGHAQGIEWSVLAA
jgi:hypothetical protein